MVSVSLILLILILPPIVMMSVLMEKRMRMLMLFVIFGIFAAFVSSQINSAVSASAGISQFFISIHIAPVVEEALKALPIVLYIFAAKPPRRQLLGYAIGTGLGFAFFENAWAFSQSVSMSPTWTDVSFALSRGFGASMVHSLCTFILVYGISLCIHTRKLLITGSLALFSLVATFHSLFNVLIGSRYTLAPFLLTLGTYVLILIVYMRRRKKETQAAE